MKLAPAISILVSCANKGVSALLVEEIAQLNRRGFGVSVANDCAGKIFYTNTDPILFKTNEDGGDLGSVSTVSSVSNTPLAFNEMAWDEVRRFFGFESRGRLKLNPDTGVAVKAFTSQTSIAMGLVTMPLTTRSG